MLTFFCLLSPVIGLAGHIDGGDVAEGMADGHIDKTIVGLAGAPGVLHDIVGTMLLVASQANDTQVPQECHRDR